MRLIDVDNISFKEINKALKDLSWWCDTNEQDGVIYIPSSNLIKDIGRIKDYLEYIKQQPTAFDVEKVVSELEEQISKHDLLFNKYVKDKDKSDSWSISELNKIRGLLEAIDIVKAGEIDE